MEQAYGAGISITEFDNISPCHTLFYIDSRKKTNIRQSWMLAHLTALAKTKHFPDDPRSLPFWPKPKDEVEALDDAFFRATKFFGG